MKPATLALRLLVGAGALALTVLAQSRQQAASRSDATNGPVRTNIASKLYVADAGTFTGLEALIDFEDFGTGMPIADQYEILGPVFALSDGGTPQTWLDDASPRSGQPGFIALTNDVLVGVETHGAMGVHFDSGMSRVGFEARSLDSDHMNMIVTAYRNGHEVGSRFFDVTGQFEFFGVQSGLPIDAIEITTVNPSGAAYSIDNMRFELDLLDSDSDGVPDFIDICPTLYNPLQQDQDGDRIGNACDAFPQDADNDVDGDGFGELHDNCPRTYNPDQADDDLDGIGNPCDTYALGIDTDGDQIPDDVDNCPMTPNTGQEDCDMDGVGDICDPQLVNPAFVMFDLEPGDCVEVTKQICLPAIPPKVDVLITVDTTGSMGGEINLLKNEIASFINDLRTLTGSDLRFALVDYKDYLGAHSSCSYVGTYGTAGDFPYAVLASIGSTDAAVIAAVNTLSASGGSDLPESYARVFWETTQPDSGIGFRAGAARIIVDFEDDIPHDCDVSEGNLCLSGTRGVDLGRDATANTADDIDFHDDALAGLIATNAKLFAIHSGTSLCAWTPWAQSTGGDAIQINANGTLPGGVDLADEVFAVIQNEVIDQVTLEANDDCGLDITFDPPVAGPFDVSMGALHVVVETICVPEDAEEGTYCCIVEVIADGAVIGTQEVCVNVTIPCETLDFEAPFANGHKVTAGDFLAEGITISTFGLNNFGAAIYDSAPAGANAGGLDPDLLVDLGNILILQENQIMTFPGIFDVPDDAQLGGTFVFDFDTAVELRAIDLIDIDAPPPTQTVTLTLVDGTNKTRVFTVPDGWTSDIFNDGPPGYGTLDLRDLAPQPGYASSATATEDAGFDETDVVRLVVHMQSSGAIDNLVYCTPD